MISRMPRQRLYGRSTFSQRSHQPFTCEFSFHSRALRTFLSLAVLALLALLTLLAVLTIMQSSILMFQVLDRGERLGSGAKGCPFSVLSQIVIVNNKGIISRASSVVRSVDCWAEDGDHTSTRLSYYSQPLCLHSQTRHFQAQKPPVNDVEKEDS